ncbi:MAG: molybdenum cofactor guanylyltransferase MobA [Paracoccaceae bacterium]
MESLAGSEPPPCGVILAGGEARRMGGADKAQLSLAGQPLIHHVLARFSPQVGAVAISLAAGAGQGAGAALSCAVLTDTVTGRLGPLAGILAGMDWAADLGARHLAAVPVDGPFLPADLVRRLGSGDAPRLACAGGRQHPTFGVWPVALRADLRGFLASGAQPRLRDFAARAGAVWVEFSDAGAFDNLNTPQDLRRAEARLRGGA